MKTPENKTLREILLENCRICEHFDEVRGCNEYQDTALCPKNTEILRNYELNGFNTYTQRF